MNLTQAKELFLAQYYGQKNYQNPLYKKGDLSHYYCPSSAAYEGGYLLLRSVSQLTDDEVYAIGNYLRPSKFFTINRYKSDIHITWSDDYVFNIYDDCSFGWDELNLDWEEVEVFNILKLYGVLLPFTFLDEDGNPVTKRPIEIISLGWAKIKTT